MTIPELQDGVLRRIDEATTTEYEGLESRYPIADFLREATRELLLTAPLRLLPQRDFSTAEIVGSGDGSGTVALPGNFLRLALFRLRGWLRPVFETIGTEDPLYARQLNPVTRGGPAKPVAVLLRDTEGLRLQWFSLPQGVEPHIARALYVADLAPEGLPDTLSDPLCWLTASLVLTVTNEAEAAATARQRYELTIRQR